MTFSSVITALLLVLFIISSAVVLILNSRFIYHLDIKLLNLPEQVGMSEADILENYDRLIEYNSVLYDGELELPDFPMSDSGRIYFYEVKQIFSVFQIMLVCTLVLGALFMIIRLKKGDPSFFKLGGIITLTLPLALGLLIAIGWDSVFVAFHKLFFNNDYWMFSAATDPVITILPDTFFMHCALLILLIILLSGILMLLLYSRLRWNLGKKYKSKYILKLK